MVFGNGCSQWLRASSSFSKRKITLTKLFSSNMTRPRHQLPYLEILNFIEKKGHQEKMNVSDISQNIHRQLHSLPKHQQPQLNFVQCLQKRTSSQRWPLSPSKVDYFIRIVIKAHKVISIPPDTTSKCSFILLQMSLVYIWLFLYDYFREQLKWWKSSNSNEIIQRVRVPARITKWRKKILQLLLFSDNIHHFSHQNKQIDRNIEERYISYNTINKSRK